MNPLHALECFGVGLATIAWIFGSVYLLILLASRVEAPVESWFLRHPKVGHGVVIGLACGVCFCIFELGCSIMGAK